MKKTVRILKPGEMLVGWEPKQRSNKTCYPWDALDVGQSFFVPCTPEDYEEGKGRPTKKGFKSKAWNRLDYKAFGYVVTKVSEAQ